MRCTRSRSWVHSLFEYQIGIWLVLFLGGLSLNCRTGEPLERVRVTGASTLYPIVQMAGEKLKSDGVLLVEAQAGGSTRGFEDTIAGRNQMGAMARELTETENSQVKKYPIAFDGVSLITHGTNPVTDLTTESLRKIYRGEITNWNQLGGADAGIVVVSKAEGHATLESFLAHTKLGREDLQVDVVAGDNAQVIRAVAHSEHAIGYVSMAEVIHSVEVGMSLKMLALDQVEPSISAVSSGDYPITRTLYLVSKQEPVGGSRVLLDFLRSDRGRTIIERGNYVPFLQ